MDGRINWDQDLGSTGVSKRNIVFIHSWLTGTFQYLMLILAVAALYTQTFQVSSGCVLPFTPLYSSCRGSCNSQ